MTKEISIKLLAKTYQQHLKTQQNTSIKRHSTAAKIYSSLEMFDAHDQITTKLKRKLT